MYIKYDIRRYLNVLKLNILMKHQSNKLLLQHIYNICNCWCYNYKTVIVFFLLFAGYEILQYMNVLLINVLVEILSQNQYPILGSLVSSNTN